MASGRPPRSSRWSTADSPGLVVHSGSPRLLRPRLRSPTQSSRGEGAQHRRPTASRPGASRTITSAWTQELEQSEVLTASGGFYDTLGVTAAVGRTFSEADDQHRRRPCRPGRGDQRLRVAAALRGRPGRRGATVRIGPTPTPSSALRRAGFFGVTPGVAPDHDSADQQQQAVVAAIAFLELGPPARPPSRRCLARRGEHRPAAFWPAALESDVGHSRAERRAQFPRTSDLAGVGAVPASRASATGSRSRCGSCSRWSRCCSPWPAPAPRTSCSRRAGGDGRSPFWWRSAPAAARLVRQMLTESMV